MDSIGIFGSFLGGVLSLLSPCSALLLPAFFAYAFQSTRQLLLRTTVFFLGLSSVLVPVGLGVGWLGSLLAVHRDTLIAVGGWTLVIFGVMTLIGAGFRIPILGNHSARIRGAGWASVFLLGAVYGFAGFCAGPLLGAVLTTAALTGSTLYGGLIMLAYSFGMSLPLFLLAWGWDRFSLGTVSWLRGRATSIMAGLMFILIGLLFIFSNGTSGLPALLSVDRQLAAQTWVLNAISGRELLLLLLVLLAGLGVSLWGLIRRWR
ncbi:cytochrome c biogenesis CcdA family protein [Staphylococcus chromogenes]|nr:cytochrome c biogenesis CcdA family protein [Staphylococcus chromogenes]